MMTNNPPHDADGAVNAAAPVLFVGAGPGDPELITVKGQQALMQAELVVYAGSLVPEAVLRWAPAAAERVNSAGLELEAIVALIAAAHAAGRRVVRLHTGDPGLYGAIHEQIVALERRGIPCRVIPGVTAAFAAAAAMGLELTLPEVSQTVILTRAAGRTPVPAGEDLARLAAHGATLAIYLSIGLVERIAPVLCAAYGPQTRCLVACRVSQPGQRLLVTPLETLAAEVRRAGIGRQAVILVGRVLEQHLARSDVRSRLYHPGFEHGFRHGPPAADSHEE
jgi:precorrin-4/cobalt-precorrin-4 C11-methyltransferase